MIPGYPASTTMYGQHVNHILAPGYPDTQNQRFKEQFDFIFMKMEGLTHKANDIDITFRPKTLLSDIASKRAVEIDISESIKGVENQYDMLHSLLSWIMTNIDNHDDRVYIKTLHDLALYELPLDLKVQMAIKALSSNSKITIK